LIVPGVIGQKRQTFPSASTKEWKQSQSPAYFISAAVIVHPAGVSGLKTADESKSIRYVGENYCVPLLWQKKK
jgi:hypothetical protein